MIQLLYMYLIWNKELSLNFIQKADFPSFLLNHFQSVKNNLCLDSRLFVHFQDSWFTNLLRIILTISPAGWLQME